MRSRQRSLKQRLFYFICDKMQNTNDSAVHGLVQYKYNDSNYISFHFFSTKRKCQFCEHIIFIAADSNWYKRSPLRIDSAIPILTNKLCQFIASLIKKYSKRIRRWKKCRNFRREKMVLFNVNLFSSARSWVRKKYVIRYKFARTSLTMKIKYFEFFEPLLWRIWQI